MNLRAMAHIALIAISASCVQSSTPRDSAARVPPALANDATQISLHKWERIARIHNEFTEHETDVWTKRLRLFSPPVVQIREASHRSNLQRIVSTLRPENRWLFNANYWSARPFGPEGVMLTYQYSSGSSNHDVIMGPYAPHKWGVFLEFDAADAVRYPPEFVDLDSRGAPDILVLTDAKYLNDTHLDKAASRVQVWRWSVRQCKYVRIAACSYQDRLKVRAPAIP